MAEYEITQEGRLIEHYWEYESTPEDELPYKDEPKDSFKRFFGCIRRKKGSYQIIDINYDGTLNFYGDIQTGELKVINMQTGEDSEHPGPEPEWFEYNAEFVNGQVVSIERIINE